MTDYEIATQAIACAKEEIKKLKKTKNNEANESYDADLVRLNNSIKYFEKKLEEMSKGFAENFNKIELKKSKKKWDGDGGMQDRPDSPGFGPSSGPGGLS